MKNFCKVHPGAYPVTTHLDTGEPVEYCPKCAAEDQKRQREWDNMDPREREYIEGALSLSMALDTATARAEAAEAELAASREQVRVLRECIEAVEWVEVPIDDTGYMQCKWCLHYECFGHADDCQRQAAIAATEGATE